MWSSVHLQSCRGGVARGGVYFFFFPPGGGGALSQNHPPRQLDRGWRPARRSSDQGRGAGGPCSEGLSRRLVPAAQRNSPREADTRERNGIVQGPMSYQHSAPGRRPRISFGPAGALGERQRPVCGCGAVQVRSQPPRWASSAPCRTRTSLEVRFSTGRLAQDRRLEGVEHRLLIDWLQASDSAIPSKLRKAPGLSGSCGPGATGSAQALQRPAAQSSNGDGAGAGVLLEEGPSLSGDASSNLQCVSAPSQTAMDAAGGWSVRQSECSWAQLQHSTKRWSGWPCLPDSTPKIGLLPCLVQARPGAAVAWLSSACRQPRSSRALGGPAGLWGPPAPLCSPPSPCSRTWSAAVAGEAPPDESNTKLGH